MCDSERGPEHRQMTVAEVAEPVYADDELVTDDVPQATPVHVGRELDQGYSLQKSMGNY